MLSFFLGIYLLLSISTLSLTKDTHWIVSGARSARSVFDYLNSNYHQIEGKIVQFYDTTEDGDLPWSPTQTIKVVLANNNFFDVFYMGNIKAIYNGEVAENAVVKVRSRDFLGY